MARPLKAGLDYFPHDTDAVNDEKVEALRAIYGNDGYAFYFILLERIYRTPNSELDISDAETRQILRKKIKVSLVKFDQMLETALKVGCFSAEKYRISKVLTSNGIKNRSGVVITKRLMMRERYGERLVSDAETIPETRQKLDKVKKRKEKKSRGEERRGVGEPPVPALFAHGFLHWSPDDPRLEDLTEDQRQLYYQHRWSE